jgi:hypothetical protein
MKFLFLLSLLLSHCATRAQPLDPLRPHEIAAHHKQQQKDLRSLLDAEPDPLKKRQLLQRLSNAELGADVTRTVITNKNGKHWIRGSIDHGVTEIGVERTTCYGSCPEYTFIITSDGFCRYNGGKFAPLGGYKTGLVPLDHFHRLARLVLEIQFSELDDTYTAMITDNPTVYTTAVINGKRKTISNYAQSGPSRLWALEQLIDAARSDVKWN